MSTKQVVKKAATITTEVIFGSAAKEMKKAVEGLVNVTKTIQGIEEKSEELSLVIANKQEELATLTEEKKLAISNLDKAFAEKEREFTVDLDIRMRAKTDQVVGEYLRNKQSTIIASDELNSLQTELNAIKSSQAETIKNETAKAFAIAKAQHEAEIKLLNSEHKAKEAENVSRITVLNEKVTFLEGNIAKMYSQADAERIASVDRAKASAVGSVVIGAPDRK